MTGFADELLAGLSQRPRRVAPKWFYDRRGSELFNRICELPEYYLTRVELALLERHAAELAQGLGAEVEIIEFGAGAAKKVHALARALERPAAYRPIDLSGDFLLDAVAAVRAGLPGLTVVPIVADYARSLRLPPRLGRGPRLGFYPGSSIGNFDPPAAAALLRRIRTALEGGSLLIGVDLVKDPAVLHAAYNDAAGVTAEFNLNLWARANREARADFDLSRWRHSAFYNPPERRIEMHLVSRCAQRVRVAGRSFRFDEGDSVHTESSYKYGIEGFQRLAGSAGWAAADVWVDPERQFSLHWLRPL
ncbi:MAG TPA: L-histidine N(alpha)-methyltransferase [Burkholderiales bacterium]